MSSLSSSASRLAMISLVAAVFLAHYAGLARADATPVGALPPGPVSTISAKRGTLVAIALPQQKSSSGHIWRLARPFDLAVLQQLSEAEVDGNVVVVYRIVGAGHTTVRYALTRDDSSRRALAARTYRVSATP